MRLWKFTLIATGLLSATPGFTQNVAINTTGTVANSSAMLDVNATNMGLLIPRVALTATNAAGPIATPATSLLVYNTATAGGGTTAVSPGYYYWDGAQWVRFITGSSPGPAWMVTGNAGTNPAIHFAGTTDAVDFVIRTNNTEKMRITAGGNAGIGTSTPACQLTLGAGGTSVFGVENTSWFVAKNASATYEAYLWPRWSDNIMYLNYGANGFNIRNNGSATAMFMNNAGQVGVGNFTNPQVRLAIDGPGANVYATSAWVEYNLHVQGNENLTIGGRGRLRIGSAWGYNGLYTDGSSLGAGNDLVLGASSGIVRVGPSAGSGQNLRYANSLLRDDQGGSFEIGGQDGIAGIGTPYIDWHTNSGYTRDFDFRMIGQTDGYGPYIRMQSFVGTTQYDYVLINWIGGNLNCWADFSAWRYFANANNSVYTDVMNDLDSIDHIRPMMITDPKTHQPVLINDPATMPGFLMSKVTGEGNNYNYDIGKTASFSLGAIRMLRREARTSDEKLDARIDRLENIIVQLTGKELGSIDYTATITAFKGMEVFVIMDARVSKDAPIRIEGLSGYEIINQADGSFTVKFSAPPASDVTFTYSGKF